MRLAKILMICLCGLFLAGCASEVKPTAYHITGNKYIIAFNKTSHVLFPEEIVKIALLKKAAKTTLKNNYSYFSVEKYSTPEELYDALRTPKPPKTSYYQGVPPYSPSPNITINNPPPYPYSTNRNYNVYDMHGFQTGTIKSQNTMTYIPYEYAHPQQAEIQRGLSSAINSIAQGLARRQAMTPRYSYDREIIIKCFKEKPTNMKVYVYDAENLLETYNK
jgi:hypothetical protein